MSRIIVVDSCAELNEEMLSKDNVRKANFYINLGGNHFLANENVDIDKLIQDMKNTKEVVRTAAPTPEFFFEPAKDFDEVFFVTISSKLSGSYNVAMVAKSMLEEENPNVKVHIFDSKSAACGETLVVKSIQDLIEANETFEEIVNKVEEKIDSMNTVFVLENLDNLVKNGRMSKIAGFVASALSIYPVCIAIDGEINVKYKPRGIKKAMNKLVETVGELVSDFENRSLYITHIRDFARAELIKEKVKDLYNFAKIEIFDGTALSTTYANEHGIILAF